MYYKRKYNTAKKIYIYVIYSKTRDTSEWFLGNRIERLITRIIYFQQTDVGVSSSAVVFPMLIYAPNSPETAVFRIYFVKYLKL